MNSRYSHSVYTQLHKLIHVQKRRNRIIESIQAHFGKQVIIKLNEQVKLKAPDLQDDQAVKLFTASMPERDFLQALAFCVLFDEAATIQFLRTEASPYTQHVDEQILFAARNAGQDIGRTLLSHNPEINSSLSRLFHGLDSVWYRGLQEDNHCFVSIRPLGHISLHWESNPHIEPWKKAKADPIFQENLEAEWIHGMLDVLSPQLCFVREQSLAKGNRFGLCHLIENRRLSKGHPQREVRL